MNEINFTFRVLILSILISLVNNVSHAAEKTITIEIDGLPIEIILNTETRTAAISSNRLWYDNRDSYPAMDLVIPHTIEDSGIVYDLTEIQPDAFKSCLCIESVTMPSSITTIGARAFSTCSAMKSVEISKNVTLIPENCFSGCTLLKEIIIPDFVQEIDANAFVRCLGLEKLVIPSSVVTVKGNSIWGRLDSIKEIYIGCSDPSIFPKDLFYNGSTWQVNQNVKVYVPKECVDAYKSYFNFPSGYDNSFIGFVMEQSPKSIHIDKENLSLNIGESTQIIATVLPEGIVHEPITWESSNNDVVIVTKDGVVTALAFGDATITVKSGELIATCSVNVVEVAVRDIQITGVNASDVYFIGRSYQMRAVISPDNATNKEVTWMTDNQTLATVTEDGLLTCHAEGLVTVTAAAGGLTREVKLHIKPVELQSITIKQDYIDMFVGEEQTLDLVFFPNDATNQDIEWRRYDENLISIKNNCVKAIGAGETVVRAYNVKNDVWSTDCRIKILLPEVTSLTLSTQSMTLAVGKTAQLSVAVEPEIVNDAQLEWSSSNNDIASVDENGLITAIAPGEAIITVKSGKVKATCNVTVEPLKPESLTLELTSVALLEGETRQLNATVLPEEGQFEVKWSVVDEGIATITTDGLLTAVSAGETIVTAKCGELTVECKVFVTKKVIAVEEIKLSLNDLTLTVGKETELQVSILPADATDPTVTWSSDNPNVAVVTNGLVKAVGVGNAVITVTSGELTATCNVIVEPLKPESITLELTSVSLLEGETKQLKATVLPEEGQFEVKWSVDDEGIATITSDGLLTAVSAGETIVTAKCGELTVECKVVVTKKIIAVEGISLSSSAVTLTEGEETVLTVSVLPADATDQTAQWSTSDESIVTVLNGTVKAIAEGIATITVSVGDKKAECEVTVKKAIIVAESITIEPSVLVMSCGDSQQLKVDIKPANTTDKTIVWTSNNNDVATVIDGIVTAKSVGDAVITAQCGDINATCKVTVEPIKPQSLTLELTSVALLTGETKQLKATVLPLECEFIVEWSVADTKIATITSDGQLTAVGPGETIITAKCGDLTAECKVFVTKNVIAVETVKLSASELTLTEGEEAVLSVTILPADATDPVIIWSTYDELVATVTDGTIKALAKGTTVITASVNDKKAECKVTVKSAIIAVESITLDPSALVLKCGEARQIKADVKPDNSTDRTIKWNSSNPDIATVDNDGIVTAINPGTANITASAGDKMAVCRLIVNPIEVSEIILSAANVELNPGKNIMLKVTIKPDNATDKTVVWTSDNNNVATVSDGLVTAISEGEALITARCGSQTAVCIVNVIPEIIILESIRIAETEIVLETEESKRLTFITNPTDAYYETIEWKSSNDRIATVSSDGVVTGISKGEAFIWLTVDNKADACKVSVVDPIKTSVNDVERDKGPVVRTMPGSIVITNLDSKDNVGVYTISGMTIRPQSQARTTDLTIKVNIKGIYIVRINNNARKIVVR